MDAGQVRASTYTELFEGVFPYYLALGMTYEQFWVDDPALVKAYRKAEEIRKRRMNEELWLNGIYTAEALASTVGNMFSKSKYKYPSEPKPITMDEIRERKEREQKARMERIKAAFTSKALVVNANLGAKQ